MKLLTASEAAGQPVLRTFRSGDWMGPMLVSVVMLGIATYTAVPKGDPTPVPMIAVPVLVGLGMFAFATYQLIRAYRPDNWRLKLAEGGMLIHLYPHSAPQRDPKQPSVVWLDAHEVAAVCHTLVTHHFPLRGRTTFRRPYIDIYLTHEDTGALRDLLHAARRRVPLRQPVEVPVRVLDPPGVRMSWEWIRPPEKQSMKLIGQQYPVGPSQTPTVDWDDLNDKAKEAFLCQLWENGQVDEALGALRQYKHAHRRTAWEWLEQRCFSAPPPGVVNREGEGTR